MSPQPAHQPAESQKDVLYDAMSSGDWSTVEELRQDADPEQFEADRFAAWTRYQADHEMPEKEREANTKAHVKRANDRANEHANEHRPPPR
jgi:hypothetical protein